MNIPRNAEKVSSLEGVITHKGKNEGKRIYLALWEGYASLGAKSNFSRIPVRWLVVKIWEPGNPVSKYKDINQYSGRRYEEALIDFNNTFKHVRIEITNGDYPKGI